MRFSCSCLFGSSLTAVSSIKYLIVVLCVQSCAGKAKFPRDRQAHDVPCVRSRSRLDKHTCLCASLSESKGLVGVARDRVLAFAYPCLIVRPLNPVSLARCHAIVSCLFHALRPSQPRQTSHFRERLLSFIHSTTAHQPRAMAGRGRGRGMTLPA